MSTAVKQKIPIRTAVRNSRTDRARELQPNLNREYIVPVLIKCMQILQLLADYPPGLHIEQIHRRTKISKSTVYRIVRTLVACGGMIHRENGAYTIVFDEDLNESDDDSRAAKMASSAAGIHALISLDQRIAFPIVYVDEEVI